VDLTIYGYAAVAVLHTALAAGLLADPVFRRAVASRTFVGAVAATAAWGWFALASRYATSPVAALCASAFDLLRYILWLACLLLLLRAANQARRFSAGALLVPIAVGLVGVEMTLAVLRAFVSTDATLAKLTFASALSLPVYGLVLVEQLYRNLSDDSRWSSKPFCLALTLLFVFDIYFFSHAALFSRFDADSVSIRGAIHSFCVPLLLLASKRQSKHHGNLRLSRAAAFHTATLLLVGLYLLFISAIGYYVKRFGGDWGSALQLALLFVAAIALVSMLLSGALRARLRVFVGKNFFTYRYDYRAEWLRFTAMLSGTTTQQEVGVSVIRGLADLVESPGGAIWSKGPSDSAFVQTCAWNMARAAGAEAVDSSLIAFLQTRGWIIDVDEYRSSPRRYDGLQLPSRLLEMPTCWLVIPLQVADELIGFAVLAHARTPVQVNWEVRDLLKTASRQAAGFLAQMHATESLLEARKFDAFNRMSAFVVHDLKNIVTQLSLMLKNAKRLHANPEFQQDMLATIENSLDKMRQLMLQLREGEANSSGFSGVDLMPIARRIGALAAQRGRAVELRMSGEGVVTRGNEERIERVLGHVVQNAIDATMAADRVWLEVARSSGQAKVVVGDTGQGMTQEFVRTRLFKPFNSTKEGGMGIGAYESFQYLKELGGSIDVDSEIDRGTIVTIRLPLLETQARPEPETSSTR
jgi:putative PEP-CTERM system histidine kinase